MRFGLLATLAAALWAGSTSVVAQTLNGTINKGPFPLDLNGSNKTYDWPIETFEFDLQKQPLQVAFMDVKPACSKPNGLVVLMLHGKNFCSITWRQQIKTLTKAGYRVLAVDNLGFCKSSKPMGFQYSLGQYAYILNGLLHALEIDKVILLLHSYGNMIGSNFVTLYPDSVQFILAVDGVGWEDYVANGVPYASIDDNTPQEEASNFDSIKAYENTFYYNNMWNDSLYDEWVEMLDNIYHGSQREGYIEAQTKTVDVVLNEPTVEKWKNIPHRTYFFFGSKDATFIGAWASQATTSKLGRFSVFAPRLCASMAWCKSHEFEGQGHSAQISSEPEFEQAMMASLNEGRAILKI